MGLDPKVGQHLAYAFFYLGGELGETTWRVLEIEAQIELRHKVNSDECSTKCEDPHFKLGIGNDKREQFVPFRIEEKIRCNIWIL